MIAWRGQDARRNAVSMIAQSRYSHKSLQGVSSAGMRQRLEKDGVHLCDFPSSAMNGTLIYAHRTMLPLEEDIRLKIPEHSRPGPDHLFERKLTLLLDDCHPRTGPQPRGCHLRGRQTRIRSPRPAIDRSRTSIMNKA